MRKNKFLLLLVLLAAVVTGAWAQTETLLTTITPTAETTYSETTAGVVTVTPIGHANYDSSDGWRWNVVSSGSVTVEAKEGYTITKCVFKQNAKTPVTISTSPFAITFVDGECEQNNNMNGVTSIEVYGTPAATGYSITLDEGTGNKDSQNWEITPKSSELSGSEAVTVKYNGSREVKSVTVVKLVKKAVDNTYLTWDGTQKKLVETEIPAEVTTVTSSTTTWTAGTYVVEGEVDITGTIELKGDVDLIIKDGAKLTVNGHINGDFKNLSIYGQAQKTGQLVVNGSNNHAISGLSTLEVHSAEVTATASGNNSHGGISSIDKFNVYGGLVDAKSTAADGGYGISLSGGGSMDIWGGEVKAEGKGNGDWDCGIVCGAFSGATVTVHGGKLSAWNAAKKAFNYIDLKKGEGFTGKIYTDSDAGGLAEYTGTGTPDTWYVEVY